MGPLTGYRIWFADEYQQRANAWMLMVLSMGFVFSTLPVQLLLPVIGWRWIFGLIAILILLIIILTLLFIPSWKTEDANHEKNAGSLSVVWKNKFFRSTIPLGLFNYGGMVAIQTLWAGPWMVRVSGYTPLESATGLFWINTTMLVAFFVFGYILPKITKLGLETMRNLDCQLAIYHYLLLLFQVKMQEHYILQFIYLLQ